MKKKILQFCLFNLLLLNCFFVSAQCNFLTTTLFECDEPFDMDERLVNLVPGTWSGGAFISSDGMFDPSGLTSGLYSITLTTSQAPCAPQTSFTVTVAETPQVELSQNTLEVCENASNIDLVTFETDASIPGFWSGSGVINETTFDPSGLSGEVEVTFTAHCDNNTPASCTPPFVPNPVCGCDGNFYSSVCAAQLEGVTTYTPWIANFPPSCPDGGGCEPDTEILTITVNPSTEAILTETELELCDEGIPININTLIAPESDTGTWNVGATLFNPAIEGIGVYALEYSTGTGTCDDTATLTITVSESNTVILPQQSLIVCSDESTVDLNNFVGAGSAIGEWNGIGVNSATGIFDISQAGLGSHTLTYSSGFDTCDNLETFLMIVQENTEALLTTDAITICSEDPSIDLNEYVDLASSPGNWSGSGVNDNSFNPSVGSQLLTFNTEPGTCDDSADLLVTVIPSPNAILNTTIAEACFSDGIINLSQYVSPLSTEGIWAGQGVTSLTSEFDVSAGTQVITFSSFSGDCEDVESLEISVFSSPTVELTQNNISICANVGNINLSTFLTPETDSGGWSGTGIEADDTSFNPSAGSQVLTYTTNLGVCDESIELNIGVVTPPDATTLPPPDIQLCSNSGTDFIQALNLADFVTGDIGGTWSYSPTVNGATPISGNIFNSNGLPANLYTITYSIDSGEPCEIVSSSQVIEVAICQLECIADASFDTPSPMCAEAGNTLDLNTLITGDTGGTWTTDAPNGTITGNSFNPVGLSDEYLLSYTVNDTNPDCPPASQSTNITIAPPPMTTTTAPIENFCTTDNGFDLMELVEGDMSGTWSSSDAPSAIDDAGFFSFSGITAGQYEVSYTIAAQAPCTEDASSTETIVIEDNNNTAGEDREVCTLSIALDAMSTESGIWTTSSTPSASATADFIDASFPQTIVEVNEAGVYTFLWSHTDPFSNSCFDEDEVNITFLPLLQAATQIVCAPNNLSYEVTVTLSGGVPPYFVGGTLMSGNTYTLTANNDEPFNVVFDDAGNCEEIPVSGSHSCFCPPPDDPAAVSSNVNYCTNTSIPSLSAIDNGVDSYRWYANETDTEPIGEGVNFTPDSPGTYWLESISPDDCASANRTPIVLQAIPPPPPPIVLPISTFIVENQYFIATGTPSEGGTINWYNEAGELVFTGTDYQLPSELIGSFTLFVTETVGSCESEPTPFDFTVNPFDIETCPHITQFNVIDTLHLCTGEAFNLSLLNDDSVNLLASEWLDLEGNVLSDTKILTVSETVTGCDPLVVQYVARTYCVINPVEAFDVDTATVVFYPFPETANFTVTNAGCTIQITPEPNCPNFSIYTDEDELIEDGVFNFPIGNGTSNFILANDDADFQGLFDCSGTFEYDYNCSGSNCPIISSVDAPTSICSGTEEILSSIIEDTNNQLHRIEWLLPDGSTIEDQSLLINETTTGCDTEILTYELRLYCTQDTTVVFDSRTIEISLYPAYDANLLTIENEECNIPTVSSNCNTLLITAVDVPPIVEEGDSGIAIWAVSNDLDCFQEEISVAYNCPDLGCPTVNPPIAVSATTLNACEDSPNFPDFEAQTEVGAIVNWYDVPIGGTALLENNIVFTPTTGGVFYAEAMTLPDSCRSALRTAFELILNPLDDASFNYSSSTYCPSAGNPLPENIAMIGGTFSSLDGITIDPTTGEIELANLQIGETYTIEYQTNGNCPNMATFDINIQALDDASFSYPSVSYCLSEANPLPENIATPNGTFSSPDGITVNPTTGEVELANLNIGETYTIEYQTIGACTNIESFLFNIIEDNIEVDAGVPIPICRNDPIPLNGILLAGSSDSFQWSSNIGGNFDDPLALIGSFELAETVDNLMLYLTASNNCGDTFVDSVEVSITENIELSFTGNTTLDLGDTVQLEVIGGNNGYNWITHPDLSCTDCADPIFTANTLGTNTLVVESADNCSLPLTINILVNDIDPREPQLMLPNAFSPNGDGNNDTFQAVASAPLERFNLMIYNRWGEQVFQSSAINEAWNGIYENEVGDIGVYVYVLQYQFVGGQEELKRGNVTLVR